MDHSYSKERDRMQKTDHCYFTVGKKTPQVVLRKAQQLKEQTQNSVKSSVGQDHSYVRGSSVITSLAVIDNQSNQSLMASPYIGFNSSNGNYLSPLPSEENRLSAAEALLALDQSAFRCSVMDDLRCWIGSIQLDHAYNGRHNASPGRYEDSATDDDDFVPERFSSGCDVLDEPAYVCDDSFDLCSSDSAIYYGECLPSAGVNDSESSIGAAVRYDTSQKQQLSGMRRCRSVELHPTNSSNSDAEPKSFSQHFDHAYDVVGINSATSFDEFQSDHSYDTRQRRCAQYDPRDSRDWWDHAYVENHGTFSPAVDWRSYGSDVKMTSRMGDIVEGALV